MNLSSFFIWQYGNELYNLVTDQGYLNERDLVWEKLNEVLANYVYARFCREKTEFWCILKSH